MDPFPFPFPRKSALPSCDSEAAALTPDIRLLLFLADPFLLASPSPSLHALPMLPSVPGLSRSLMPCVSLFLPLPFLPTPYFPLLPSSLKRFFLHLPLNASSLSPLPLEDLLVLATVSTTHSSDSPSRSLSGTPPPQSLRTLSLLLGLFGLRVSTPDLGASH